MRKLLRKWLGVDTIDDKIDGLIEELTGVSPEDVKEISRDMVEKRKETVRKFENNFGEGDL